MPQIEISIPYSPGLLKNKKVGFARGRYYTRKEYSDAVKSLTELVWGKSRGQKWIEDKIWVEIFLQKERKNTDVANLVDSICDAIKTGIGIDDMYYSIKADWESPNKEIKPYINITITQ